MRPLVHPKNKVTIRTCDTVSHKTEETTRLEEKLSKIADEIRELLTDLLRSQGAHALLVAKTSREEDDPGPNKRALDVLVTRLLNSRELMKIIGSPRDKEQALRAILSGLEVADQCGFTSDDEGDLLKIVS